MNIHELKRAIEESSDEDKLILLAFLKQLLRRDDSAYKEMLAQRVSEMQVGNKVSLAQAKRLHEAFEAAGL